MYTGQGEGSRQQLMLRTLDNVLARPLPGTEDASQPIFSPDGRWIAFIRGNQLYKLAVDGSAPQLLGTAPGTFNGASWSATGVIVVSGNTALFVIPESGGKARELGRNSTADGELYRDAPLVVDAEESVVYSSWGGSSMASARIAIASLATGEATVFDLSGIQPLGIVDGTLVYVTAAGVIMGVPIDVAERRLLGPPVQLVDNVTINASTGLAQAALSRRTLFYQSGSLLSQVVAVGRGGATRTLLGDRRDYGFPRLSPDGHRLAITVGTSDHRDVWLYELSSGAMTRLTTEGTTNERPEWSPDGSRVLYRSDRETRTAIWWRTADLSSEAKPLLMGDRLDVFEAVLSPDARTLVYQLDTLGADIYYRALAGDTTPRPVATSRAAIETMPRVSPDGRLDRVRDQRIGPGRSGRPAVPGAGRARAGVGHRRHGAGVVARWAPAVLSRRRAPHGGGNPPGPGVRRRRARLDPPRYLRIRRQPARQLRRDARWRPLHLPSGSRVGGHGGRVELGVGAAIAHGRLALELV